ncbi:MAG: type III secretion system needle length determinant, SpaN/EivJ family [Iodobacter sp.]
MGQVVATTGQKTGAIGASEPSYLLSEFTAQLSKQKKKKGIGVVGEVVVPLTYFVDKNPLALHLGMKTENKLQGEVRGQKNVISRVRADLSLRSLATQTGSLAMADGMRTLTSQPLKMAPPHVLSGSDSLAGGGNRSVARRSDISAPLVRPQAMADVASLQAQMAPPHVLSGSDSLAGGGNRSVARRADISAPLVRPQAMADVASLQAQMAQHSDGLVSDSLAAVQEGVSSIRVEIATPDSGEDDLLSAQEQMLAATTAKGEGSFTSRAPAMEAHGANHGARSEAAPGQETSDVAVAADQQADGQMLYRFNRWGGEHSVSIQAQSQEGNLQLELQPSNAFVQDRLQYHLQQIDGAEHWTLLGDSEQQQEQQQGQDQQDEEKE